jgi:hypothetical protein
LTAIVQTNPQSAGFVDLRHAIDSAANPQTVAGALHFDPKEIEQHQELISRDRNTFSTLVYR